MVVRIWQGYLEGLRTAMGVNLAAAATPRGTRADGATQLRTVNLTGEKDEPEPEDRHELGDQDKEPDDDDQPPEGPPQATRPRRGARPWPNCLLGPGHRPYKQGETLDYGNFLREATEWRRLAALRQGHKTAVETMPTSTSMSSLPPSTHSVKPVDQPPGGPLQGSQEGQCSTRTRETPVETSTSTPTSLTSPTSTSKSPGPQSSYYMQAGDQPPGGPLQRDQEGQDSTMTSEPPLATLTSTPTSSTSPWGPGMAWNLAAGGPNQEVPDTQLDEPHADDDGQDADPRGGQH